MPRKECLEHPGCIWSCPCDCLNCINFETVLRRQSRPEVAYSPAAASSPRDVSNSGLWASSSCEGRVFSETFYDALLPPPGVEPPWSARNFLPYWSQLLSKEAQRGAAIELTALTVRRLTARLLVCDRGAGELVPPPGVMCDRVCFVCAAVSSLSPSYKNKM